MNANACIAHFDLDSFFVSVELINNPELKGKPVIVGGRERGVVTTCSYEARKFGVHSGMPSSKARQLCPQAIFIKGRHGEYSRYSRWVTQIIAEKAPLFEKASIDEFYIDLSGMERFFNPLAWTIELRKKIMDETGLPISFGLATNKLIAKIATNQAKPNGYLEVPAGQEKAFLAPLPVSAIPGVGDHTHEILQYLGIHKIRDIDNAGPELLEEKLGKWGIALWNKSQGIYEGGVSSYHEAKSVSSERTFEENKSELDFLDKELIRLTEKIAFELREDKKVAGCIAVKIRYTDFDTHTKQATIPYTAADDEMIPVVKKLFQQLYHKNRAVRLLGVKLSDLTGDAFQPSLFSDTEKKQTLYKAIDEVRNRFGKNLLHRASSGKNSSNKKG